MEQSSKLQSGFIQDIIELSIAIETENQAWAKKIILRILGWGAEELTFRVQRYSYGNKERLKDFNNIIDQLNDSVSVLLENDFLSKALNSKVQEFLKGENSDWSWPLVKIRERLKSNYIDGKVWSFLFQKLLKRTSEKEALLLLRKNMDKNFVNKMNLSEIWLFHYYYPADEAVRKKALEKIHSAWLKGDAWLKQSVVKLIGVPVIKRELAGKESMFRKALFQIERRFYRDLLSQGQAVDFALYGLMGLGDNNPRILWWLAF